MEKSKVVEDLRKVLGEERIEDLVFFCIGCTKSTGDSLGPLVGYMLKKLGYENVIGTLEDPVHALNLKEKLSLIEPNKKIVAIDACIGRISGVGEILIKKAALHPGKGFGKYLGSVGDYIINGIVMKETGNLFRDFVELCRVDMSLVYSMAEKIVGAIEEVFNGEKGKNIEQEFKGFREIIEMMEKNNVMNYFVS